MLADIEAYVPDGFPGSRISMFLSQIPWNYYCILTLIMVIGPIFRQPI